MNFYRLLFDGCPMPAATKPNVHRSVLIQLSLGARYIIFLINAFQHWHVFSGSFEQFFFPTLQLNAMIKNYFKIALRNFWKHKLFTLINMIGLSIGISSALVIYLIVHFDFTFNQNFDNGDQIYRVVSNYTFSGEEAHNRGVSGPVAEAGSKKQTAREQDLNCTRTRDSYLT